MILLPDAVGKLNSSLCEQGLIEDPSEFPPLFDGAALVKSLDDELEKLRASTLYSGGKPVEDGFWEGTRAEMALEDISSRITVGYGFILRRAEQRLLPTEDCLSAEPDDNEFDELQNSSLDIGMPLAVLHHSRSGRGLYAVGRSSSGWLRRDKVVLAGRGQLLSHLSGQFCVVTSAKADIFSDPALRSPLERCRMGTRLRMSGRGDGSSLEILAPGEVNGAFEEVKAYIGNEHVCAGFLPYTQRNILNQAFKLLDAPYGWGGAHGEQDCSGFMQEIFATVGIDLPRNSGAQAKVGRPADLVSALPGATLLGMKGHIMLYLGRDGDQPYAIHSVWAYREPGPEGDAKKVIGKVAVTPLKLGEGSQKGSWLKRINSIKIVE